MDEYVSFGSWLKRRRKALDLTQAELARRVGCAAVTIQKIEADERRPSWEVAEALADQLGIPAAERALFLQVARAERMSDNMRDPAENLPPAPPAPPAAPPEKQAAPAPPPLPSGTVTFLVADVESSARLWEQDAGAMQRALAQVEALLRAAIAAHSGALFRSGPDGFHAVFQRAPDALAAALDAQCACLTTQWHPFPRLPLRMALHTGTAEQRDGDYSGLALARLACLLEAGHGQQVLLSLATEELVADALPAGAALRDLGTHHLQGLERTERIFQLLCPPLPADFPPLRARDPFRHNLPALATPLLGRDALCDALRARLLRPHVRLVTLTGPGGVGKTSLALQLAWELLPHFEDGVWFVNLAPLDDPSLVLPAIARVLGVAEQPGQPLATALKEALRPRQLLLLLDNFEQLLPAAPMLAELLAAAPRLKLCVTSRALLHLRGEHEFPVPPLALPDAASHPTAEEVAACGATALFVERVQALRPNFQLTAENAPVVAAICQRLDGLPLAIELAAARSRQLSPQGLLARLERRLPLLTHGAGDLPARQQTLRDTIAWSFNLLDAGEQRLFVRLAVFVGGWTLPAAEAVCDAAGDLGIGVMEGHDSLLDKSLIRVAEDEAGDTRFARLQTIREFAREQLAASGEADALRARHARFFLALAQQAEPELHRAEQDRWAARLEQEHDNFRAALNWSREAAPDVGVQLVAALWRFWEAHAHLTEGRYWLEAMLARSEGAPAPARAAALTGAGTMAWLQADYERAFDFHQQALALYRDLGDQEGITFALNNLGMQRIDQGRYAEAIPLLEESLALARALGDKRLMSYALHNLGTAALYTGKHERAAAFYAESLALGQQIGHKWVVAHNLTGFAYVNQQLGRFEEARAHYRESLLLCDQLGDRESVALCLDGLAAIHHAEGRALHALRLLAAADALRQRIGASRPAIHQAAHERLLAALRAEVDGATWATTWAEAGRLPLDDVLALALAEEEAGARRQDRISSRP